MLCNLFLSACDSDGGRRPPKQSGVRMWEGAAGGREGTGSWVVFMSGFDNV